MLKRLITLVLYTCLSTTVLFSQASSACDSFPDPNDFEVICSHTSIDQTSRIKWCSIGDVLGGYLFKWFDSANTSCTDFSRANPGITLYSENNCSFTEEAQSRTCYKVQYFDKIDACRSDISAEKCSCPDLYPEYKQIVNQSDSLVPTTSTNSDVTFHPCDLQSGALGVAYAGRSRICSDVPIDFSNTNSALVNPDTCTPNDLQRKRVKWDLQLYKALNSTSAGTLDPGPGVFESFKIYHSNDPSDPNDPNKDVWGGSCFLNASDQHEVTASLPSSATSTCTSQLNNIGRMIYRTPWPEVTFDETTGYDEGNSEYWGCTQCLNPAFNIKAWNYEDLSYSCNQYTTFSWRDDVAGIPVNTPNWNSNNNMYSVTTAGHHLLQTQAGLGFSLTVPDETDVDCLSEKTSMIVRMGESPPPPQIEGLVSLCKSDIDGNPVTVDPFTLTVQNTQIYDAGYDWRQCRDFEYQGCYNETADPLSCQIRKDTDSSNSAKWGVNSDSSTSTYTVDLSSTIQPNWKRAQFYLRAFQSFDSNPSHKCFGESFYSVHLLDNCQTIPGGGWSDASNNFFPATSVGDTFPTISDGHNSGTGLVHTNAFGASVQLNNPEPVALESGTTYTFAFWTRTVALFPVTAYLSEYDNDGTLLVEHVIDLEPLTISVYVGGPYTLGGTFISIGSEAVSVNITLQNGFGFHMMRDAMIHDQATNDNLIPKVSSFCEGAWSYTSDPLYPGTGLVCTDKYEPSAEPKLYIHNLASGSIVSTPVSVSGNPDSMRITYHYRGETMDDPYSYTYHPKQLTAILHLLDNNGTEIETIEESIVPESRDMWQAVTHDFGINVTFSAVQIELLTYGIDGWIAFDDLNLEQLGGKSWSIIALPDPGFENYDESTQSLNYWTVSVNSEFPATAGFHPVYYPPFYPSGSLANFVPWGPIQGRNYATDNKFAVSISNQMYGISKHTFTVDEYADYELSVWIRGELDSGSIPGNPYHVEIAPIIALISTDSDGVLRFQQTYPIPRDTVSLDWRQIRANIVAHEGDTIEISLSSPYLNGWVAFSDVVFGKYNRPPSVQATDDRYIPNQEIQPELLAGDGTINKELEYFVTDPDEDPDKIDIDPSGFSFVSGDPDVVTKCFSENDFSPEYFHHISIVKDCSINQETKASFTVVATDPENDDLTATDTGSLILEPFWGLNPGFEAEEDADTPLYWQMDADDPRFPATSSAYEGYTTLPFSGNNAAMKGNLATGYITSNVPTVLDPGYYNLSVYSKGTALLGDGIIMAQCAYDGSEDAFSYFTPAPEDWNQHSLDFEIPENKTGYCTFYFGIEDYSGWILFDDSELTKFNETTQEYDYIAAYNQEDPGFEAEPYAVTGSFWNYGNAALPGYPATSIEHYSLYQTIPQQGGDPAGVGMFGPGEGDYAVLMGNEFSAAARQSGHFTKKNINLQAITFSYAYNLLDRSAQHNGAIDVIITLSNSIIYPPTPDRAADTTVDDREMITHRIVISDLISNGWKPYYLSISTDKQYMRYRLNIHHGHGWIAVDDINAVGFTYHGDTDLGGPASGGDPNGSFETLDSSGEPVNWLLLADGDYPGSGIFINDATEGLFPISAQTGLNYLVTSNLAKGSAVSRTHQIAGGQTYEAYYWNHCFKLNDMGSGGSQLQFYDNDGIPLTGTTQSTFSTFDGHIHLGSTTFAYPNASSEGLFDFSYKVDLIEGYCSFDDLILKPSSHVGIVPDPVILIPSLLCDSDSLTTASDKSEYQWYLSNQLPEDISPDRYDSADTTSWALPVWASGNYSVEYRDGLNRVLGFAEPVEVHQRPRIFFWRHPGPMCPAVLSGSPLTLTAFVYTPNSAIQSCRWDFGDGTFPVYTLPQGNKCIATHIYTLPLLGSWTYTTRLIATTTDGCSSTRAITVWVYPRGGPYPDCPILDPPLPILRNALTVEPDQLVTMYEEGDPVTQDNLTNFMVRKTAKGQYKKYGYESFEDRMRLESILEDLTFEELLQVYVEEGVQLTDKDLKKLEHIIKKQKERGRK